MSGYGQFCPVAKAAEVLCQRWTVLVVRELLCGSTRFGDIRRGVPGCPPATLTKRLRELEGAGVVARHQGAGGVTYALTEAGAELFPIVEGLGTWGQRWVRSDYGADELNTDVLLWDIRRYLSPGGLGAGTVVVQLEIRTPAPGRRWYWIVAEPDVVDLCMVDPQRSIDLVVSTDLRTLTEVWMGDTTFRRARDAGGLVVSGARAVADRFPDWLGQHPLLAPVGPAR